METLWRIDMLGGLRAYQQDREITRFQTYKTGALLAYLAFYLDRIHAREALIALLWPESSLEQGRPSLSVALSSLRHQLEPPGTPAGAVLMANRITVQLNPAACITDVAAFETALRSARQAEGAGEQKEHLLAAIELYRGEMLPGHYEDWCVSERQRLADLYSQALRDLIRRLVKMGDLAGALDYGRRAVNVDPLREELHGDLMRLYVAVGQPSSALRQYRELEQLLKAELNTRPSSPLRRLANEIESRMAQQPDETQPPSKASPSATAPARPSAALHPSIPAGTVTFLLTGLDSKLKQADAENHVASIAYPELRRALAQHGGWELRERGDGLLILFSRASDALACALTAQRALAAHQGPPTGEHSLFIPMALHTAEVGTAGQPLRPARDLQDPALKRVERLLLAAHGGQILCTDQTAALLHHYSEPVLRLVDLGMYRLQDMEAPERLFEVRYPDRPQAEFPPPKAPPAPAASLPLRFTRFFGRTDEIARLAAMLVPSREGEKHQPDSPTDVEQRSMLSSVEAHSSNAEAGNYQKVGGDISVSLSPPLPLSPSPRLVTLTGPGGTGKTRLAIEVAARLLQALQGAVWFVSLEELSDPDLIIDAITKALRLPAAPAQEPLEQVIEALAGRPALLVLDNLEQLLTDQYLARNDAALHIQTLLEQLPALRCLVTSRRRLNLTGEHEFPVLPLPVPFPSAQLFVDRAQAVRPDFQMTAGNADAIVLLCNRLEGIPLAIELAAARSQILTPAQMLARLENRFEFLAARRKDIASRHWTLRAAIDWSYQLLSPELQRFFARLSVFHGGWSLEAAEFVCASQEKEKEYSLSPPDVLDYLAQLRECSLILTEEAVGDTEEMRFRMLETLQEYSRDRLLEAGEAETIQKRHQDWFLKLALASETARKSAGQIMELERLEREHENLLASLDSLLAHDAVAEAARMCIALSENLWERGRLREGRDAVQRCLARRNEIPDVRCRAKLLSAAGWLAHLLADYGQSIWWQQESLALYEGLKDEQGQASALNNLAVTVQDQGRLAEAREWFEQSLAIARRLGDPEKIASRLSNLGRLAIQEGRHPEARERLEEAYTLFETLHEASGTAACLCNLADLALQRQDWAEAQLLSEQSLQLFRRCDDRRGIALSLANLAQVDAHRADHSHLETRIHEALLICEETGLHWLVPILLETRARALAECSDAEPGLTALAAAECLRDELGIPRPGDEQEDLDTIAARLEERLGQRTARKIRAAITAMTREEIIAQVLKS